MNTNSFEMTPRERRHLIHLMKKFKPCTIAEFGSGGTTVLFAENSSATIVSWDNYPAWQSAIEAQSRDKEWFPRVDFRLYEVRPAGPRHIEKEPVAWEGSAFDMIFIDGPRSAHETSFGRSGSFRFALEHIKPGGCLIWHDNNRPHEKKMAETYFSQFKIHNHKTIGWCTANI